MPSFWQKLSSILIRASWPKLKILNLANCHQCDCCISHLIKASWPMLTHLNLSYNNLHRFIFQELRCGKGPLLQTLDLSNISWPLGHTQNYPKYMLVGRSTFSKPVLWLMSSPKRVLASIILSDWSQIAIWCIQEQSLDTNSMQKMLQKVDWSSDPYMFTFTSGIQQRSTGSVIVSTCNAFSTARFQG